MPSSRLAEKEAYVQTLRDNLDKASACVLIDFRGVSVEAITDFRARLSKVGAKYQVVKNNLLRRALNGTSYDIPEVNDTHLKGPTGVAWSFEDASAAAKVIKAFRKEDEKNEQLEVKCGFLEDSVLNAAQVEAELASLPGKDEVRAQILAQLNAPAQSFVRQCLAPAQNLVYVLEARRRELG